MRHARPVGFVVLLAPLLAALALYVLSAPLAGADGDAYPGAYAGWFRSYGVPSIYRGGGHGCGPLAVDRPWGGRHDCGCGPYRGSYGAYGTPWSVMRRYLASEPYRATWHRHPRYWWLRRWPCRYAVAPGAAAAVGDAAAAGYGDHRCKGTDVGPQDCPFAVAALADAAEPVGTEDLLVRGLERFHAGALDRAAEDFRAAADAEPANPRAAYGRLMCSFVAKDWSGSAEALRRLAALGVLDAHDRVEAEGGFDDRKRFTNLADAVVVHLSWNVHDAEARLVAGWALGADGRPEAARVHLNAALRSNPDDPAATKLRRDLEAPAAAPAGSGEPSRPSEPAETVSAAVARTDAR